MSIILTLSFISVILFLFVKSLTNTETNYRNECVAIGILGTFTGITVSLFYFDSNNISDSIPAFLDGLKLAFITSGFGMIASSILSFRKPDPEVSNLEKIALLQKDNNQLLKDALHELSTSATSEISKSLEKVITQFNEHIEHQLGENFSELNKAFGKLVEWQEKYKVMIDSQYALMQEQHELSISKLENFRIIESERSEALSKQNQEFIEILKNHALELKEQSASIKKTIYTMNNQSLNITDSMEESVDSVNRRIKQSVEIAEDNISALIGIANGKLR